MHKYMHSQMLHMHNIYTVYTYIYIYVQYIVYQYDMICLSKQKNVFVKV